MNTGKDIRESLKKMRDFKQGIAYKRVNENDDVENAKEPDMRSLLGKMRDTKANSMRGFNQTELPQLDKERVKKQMENAFQNLDVVVILDSFSQYNDMQDKPMSFVLTGTVDGLVNFQIKVGIAEELSGIVWEADEAMNDPKMKVDEIIKTLKNFYKEFYEEWRESLQ